MSDDTLPDPPVPAEADLRGLEWMPFYGNRLFGSGFDAHADDTAFRAGLQLWWAAWNQVPAASLPDDDVALCRLAGFGRDLRTWRRHRALALRGFVRCSDGRLYHMAIAGWAIEAWERRRRDRDRKARYRTSQRQGQRQGPPRPVSVPETADRTGEDRGGEDRTDSVPTAPAPPSRSTTIPTDWEPSASARAELSLSRPDLDAPTLDRRMVEFRAWCAETGKRTFNPDATWLGFMVKTHVRSLSRDSRSGAGQCQSGARAAAASDGIDAAFARRSVLQRQ